VRLLLTVVAAGGGPAGAPDVRDLVLDLPEDATVADLAGVLDGGAAPTGPLFLGATALDPAQPVRASAVRSGAVLGLGAAVPAVLTPPDGVVDVLVTSGPGAGRVHRLAPGTATVGSAPGCTVVVDDPDLAPVAVHLQVAPDGRVVVEPAGPPAPARPAPVRQRALPGPLVLRPAPGGEGSPARRGRTRPSPASGTVDADAAVPVVHLGRRAVTSAAPWDGADALAVGPAVLRLERPRRTGAATSPTPAGATVDVNRPPRLLPARRPSVFALPPEPVRAERTPVPWLLLVAPLLLSLALWWFTRSPYTLAFAALSPLLALGNVTTSRRAGARRHREQVAEHGRRSRVVREGAVAALLAEEAARHDRAPDPATVLLTAAGPRPRLWERRVGEQDWLLLRVGTADQPSEVVLRDPAREEHEGPLRWSAPDVPVTLDLEELGVVGVAGPDARRRAVAASCLAQTAVLSSPADLDVVLLCADEAAAAAWAWVRWLPHARLAGADPAAGTVRAGSPDGDLALRLTELTALLERRRAQRREHRDAPLRHVLVVLDGARALRARAGVVSLLQDGPALGVRLLCLDADVRSLPEECRGVVDAGTTPGRVQGSGSDPVDGVRFDEVEPAWCERVGRALAPLRDSSSEDLAGSLPASSRLLEVLGLDVADEGEGGGEEVDAPDVLAAVLAARWRRSGRSTRAVVGEDGDGPFAVDLRTDGPHALVAGTTGSGKSELLQTLIASLAVGNRPAEFTFVLVDYKGGAAFEDCRDLPHTVGMVTDLDGHLTARALASLGAELKHREHQLAAAGAKDVEDYTAARDRPGGPADPLPRLLIVIDEFAALAAELPDFVSGLVDIARRGRSLGVHLLLATQRPAGVVSAEIRSNTALRIALRVTDAQDSQDVVETADAAAIDAATPGRAVARRGSAPLRAFQTARVGGRARARGSARPVPLALAAAPGLAGPAAGTDADDRPTDLARLVAALRTAADREGLPRPRSPWLPALPAELVLPPVAAPPRRGLVPPLEFGTVDLPAAQRREPAVLDLAAGAHLGIVGAPRSGRSGVLRSLAAAVARQCDPADVHLYGVDCGSGALLPLTALPHTGAVVPREALERLSRLTDRLLAEVGRRQQLLAEQGFASVPEQRAARGPGERLPHLLVLLDRWEGFLAAFDAVDGGRLVEAWMQLLQEGGGAGLTVAMTVDRSGLVGRTSTLLDDKLVLRLTDPGDFSAVGLPLRAVPATMPPGRGFRAGPTAEAPVETQVALLAPDARGVAQAAALQELARTATTPASADAPFRVDVLPTRLDADAARAAHPEAAAAGRLAVAVGGDTLGLRHLDLLEDGPGFLVAGPRRSGRSTTLLVLAGAALAAGYRVGVLTPRRSPLRELRGAGVVAALDGDAGREETAAAFAALAPGPGLAPSLLLVDDLEVLGQDGHLPDAATAHLETLRDTGCAVVAAGSPDDLAGLYRGPVVALKRRRTGVLLGPRTPADGDLFGVRLPRACLGGPAGRGVLVRAGTAEPVQVLVPAPAR